MTIRNNFFFGVYTAALALVPLSVSAQVVVSEIAWMGSSASANAEWIELRSTIGAGISLEGWTLTAEDGSPSISLSGSISGNGFFLLERTNDESVPGVTADLLYTGALGNAGEILTLKNSEGQVIDTVSSGENWQNVGGDNATKETAQKTTAGWVTAAPTPRATNTSTGSTPPLVTSEEETEEPEEKSSSSSTSSSGGGSATPAPSSAPVAKASAGKDRTVIAGVATLFEAHAYDAGNRNIESARFVWNFGDGTVAEAKTVLHQWEHPGRYAVVLEVSRFDSKASHRITVTVEPGQISLDVLQDGGVVVKNPGTQDADVSGWRISDGISTFTFPPNTTLLRGASIQLSSHALRFSASSEAQLLYPSGKVAAVYKKETLQEEEVEVEEEPEGIVAKKSTVEEVKQPVSYTPPVTIPPKEEAVEKVEEKEEKTVEVGNQVAAAAAAESVQGVPFLWWAGLAALFLLGGAGVLATRHLRRPASNSTYTDWNIIEESDKEV